MQQLTIRQQIDKELEALSDEDAKELIQIIEEGCERIDYNEW